MKPSSRPSSPDVLISELSRLALARSPSPWNDLAVHHQAVEAPKITKPKARRTHTNIGYGPQIWLVHRRGEKRLHYMPAGHSQVEGNVYEERQPLSGGLGAGKVHSQCRWWETEEVGPQESQHVVWNAQVDSL